VHKKRKFKCMWIYFLAFVPVSGFWQCWWGSDWVTGSQVYRQSSCVNLLELTGINPTFPVRAEIST